MSYFLQLYHVHMTFDSGEDGFSLEVLSWIFTLSLVWCFAADRLIHWQIIFLKTSQMGLFKVNTTILITL